MWIIARYMPTTLFSLKHSAATSSGAKSLPCPSPYSMKMALIDAAFRKLGNERTRELFLVIRKLELTASPPEKIVVNNSFIKIKRKPKKGKEPFISTVAFREYVYCRGYLNIAFKTDGIPQKDMETLKLLFPRINYFGKRGSFYQFICFQTLEEDPDSSFWQPIDGRSIDATHDAILVEMDDMGKDADLERINTFSKSKTDKKKDRISLPCVVPYRKVSSGKSFTFYERVKP